MQLHHLLSLLLILTSTPPSSSSLSSDISTLLLFKNSSDPFDNLKSWSPSTDPCSSWLGVACSSSSQSPNRITRLVLEHLSLAGPSALPILTNLTQLRVLSLKSNNLSGPIPDFSPLSSLRLLFLSHNSFDGAPPSLSFSNLTHLYRLDLSYNNLSGPLRFLGNNNSRLLTLRLDSNHFTGTLSWLACFPNLLDFNVSLNSLSGAIPPSLSHFPATSFARNALLCESPLPSCRNGVSTSESPVPPASAVATATPSAKPEEGLSPSPPATDDRRNGMSKTAVIAIVVGDFVVLLIVAGLLFCYFWRKFSKRNSSSIQETEKIVYSSTAANAAANANVNNGSVGFDRGKMVFFDGTKRFELEDLLKASAEMLGKGEYGTAYKAVIADGNVVSVKRLREVGVGCGVGRKEFENQMEVVGRLRHANLVGLKAYYYARDEKLLVYEYMAGGSLSSLLHGNRGPGRTPLDWTTRIRIAAGTARGLAYIHHHANSTSKSKLAHGSIKSTNVLLDKSLTPKLSDFALAPLFPSPPPRPRPHGGYAAPELLLDPRRPVSQKADVYALGVVLLEILTGRAATEDVNLPQWVQSVVREEWTSEVFDLELMRCKGVEEEMVGLLQVAMACVAAAPQQRPKIGQVVKMMEEIRGEGSPAYESFGEVESPSASDDTGTIGSM